MTLTTIRDGERIKEPGIYRIGMEWYHQDNCPGPSISSSGLRTIENECPAEFWAFSHLNRDAFEQPVKTHFSFGRAAHTLLLGDEKFKKLYAVRPSKWDSWRSGEAKAWREMQIELERDVLTHEDMAKITHMAAMMAQHPLIMGAKLLEGTLEASLVWQDAETGIWLKARPDVIPEFDGTISDYKTTSDATPRFCHNTIAKFGYHMQMALCAEGMKAVLGREASNFLLVFQQSTPPFHVTPVEVSSEAIYWGRRQVRRSLNTFAECMESGHWPGYSEEIPVFNLPTWLVERLIEQSDLGSLPDVEMPDATGA